MRTSSSPCSPLVSGVLPDLDAIQEMLALGLQRLFLLDVGGIHVAVMIGVMEFGKGVVVRRTLDAGVKNADFFQRRDVVINNHALAADDGHLADLCADRASCCG